MSLMKLFNVNYFKQNLKKSKATLIFFIGVIPIISSIIFLIAASQDKETFIISLEELSIINFLGIYVLPFVISLCLFGFVFKKRSVDFVNSMPISRKSIFITNSLGGIGILLLMNFVTTGLLAIISVLFSNIIVPWGIFVDYFIVWSVIYIFVFTACNLGMTVSGNFVTQIVVTLLILFLIPFLHQAITTYNFNNSYDKKVNITCTDKTCMPDFYDCVYGDDTCEFNKDLGIYKTRMVNYNYVTYTAPYNFLSQVVFEKANFNLYDGLQLVEMVILSIIYYGLGLYLFQRRKMEVCETSFRTRMEHNIVKGLTVIPIWTFGYLLISNISELFPKCLIVAMIIIYYVIYDLITKKTINNVKNMMVAFVVTSVIIVGGLVINDNRVNKELNLNINDIKGISVRASNQIIDSDDIYINNKELINLFIKNKLNNGYYNRNYMSDSECSDCYNSSTAYYSVKIKTNNNKIYGFNLYLGKSDSDRVMNILSNDKKYGSQFKNIKYNKLFAIGINNNYLEAKNYKEIINTVKDSLKNITLVEYSKLSESNNYSGNIDFYAYDNHKIIKYTVNNDINISLKEKIVSYYNNKLRDDLDKINSIHYLSCASDICSKYNFDYNDPKIKQFIKDNISSQVDLRANYEDIYIYTEREEYHFITNKIDEFVKLLESIKIDNSKESTSSEYDYYE